MTKFQDYLGRIKSSIQEMNAEELTSFGMNENAVILDVREKEEHLQGVVPNAILIPRGVLETKIEQIVPDRETPIAVYCAGGVRSAMASHTLQQLGYTRVQSVRGGFARYAQTGQPVETRHVLSAQQAARYSRHLTLPDVGEPGQIKLLQSKVLLIGAGGLGSPAALYAAAAGIGTIGIVDADTVDLSNLQRQILHTEASIGLPKTESAERAIKALNNNINVIQHRERLTSENAMDIIRDYDVVIDGCDNFSTRYLVNDCCVMLNIPNVHGSIFRFEGQVSVFSPQKGPCYRCLYPEPPSPGETPNCQEAGVLGVIPGIIGILQTIEAIKLLLEIGSPLIGRILTFDALQMEFREMRLRRNANCAVCGTAPTIKELIDYEAFCSSQKAE